MKKQNHAISVHPSIMVAKMFILQLANLVPSIFSRKMGKMMIKMETIQTVLHEEIGGRDHFITEILPHAYLISSLPYIGMEVERSEHTISSVSKERNIL